MTSRPVAEQRERELKFDVPDDWALPDPAELAPTGGSATREVRQLEAPTSTLPSGPCSAPA